ncbi:helix-turn-helix domain-containing protein [Costertonia aggregata]|uniref:Helix-turn-helix domain-containing protein n=1 Tax=Costertonia aggregata TaxID=343403 RepID=A0A7H9AN93_9FLAO|nr:AraC family transcriptional regulator [Costertonia aggregata]QLG44745.1 helix-turn-helix domain-containing protein [Costertonia aggregata]
MSNIPVREIDNTNFCGKDDGFKVLDVANFCGKENFKSELHRHDFYFLLLISKGRGAHTIDFREYEIKDNSFYIMRPGQVHQLSLEKGSQGYLIEFANGYYYPNGDILQKALRDVSKSNFYDLGEDVAVSILDYMHRVYQEFTNSQIGSREIINSNLDSIFINLYRHYLTEKPDFEVDHSIQLQLESFLDLLNTNLREKKRVEDYAEMLNLSLFQLNRITKTTMNKTCSEVIADHIVLEAKRYLLGTSNQIKEIAFELGYYDVSYFTRFFKKQTGKTPEEYRNDFK